MSAFENYEFHSLNGKCGVYIGELPPDLRLSREQFYDLWNAHPAEFHEIMMHGQLVKVPRWQQAYGMDYHYTGRRNAALPVLPVLEPLLAYVRDEIDSRLNGILLNWYTADLRHYIGRHRDSTTNMMNGAPIVTLSFGAARTFRIRPWRGKGIKDFSVVDGTVCVMPYETNLAFTHEVPHFAGDIGKRISVTFRAFEVGT